MNAVLAAAARPVFLTPACSTGGCAGA